MEKQTKKTSERVYENNISKYKTNYTVKKIKIQRFEKSKTHIAYLFINFPIFVRAELAFFWHWCYYWSKVYKI